MPPARRGRGGLVAFLLGIVAVLGACGPAAVAGGPFPRFSEFEGREITAVEFAGDLQLPVDSLRAVTLTRPSRCLLLFLPVCIPGTGIGRQENRLDLTELARDVARLQLYYRDHGYYATRVVPDVDPVAPDQVAVRFAIVPGDQVILDELVINGTEGILTDEEARRRIPLRENEPFRRVFFLASADSIRGELLRRGYAFAEVLRNYDIGTEVSADFARVEYEAIPGPLVRVDSVVVVGANRLETRTVRGMLTFREEDLLRVTELNNSQRNLYGLGMVNFASVEIAPDTLQLTPGQDSTATVLVRVVEAPQYLIDANAGYGTIDCLRVGSTWTNRNFLGGARRLEVSGSVSKLGVGWPADAGMAQNLCRALADDEFSDTLNYALGVDLQQPRLFGTRTRGGARLRGQRTSEFEAFVRRSVGAQVGVGRDLTPRTLWVTVADVDRGSTRANPAVFCVSFDICAPEVFGELQRARWSNALSTTLIHDRTTTDGATVRGWAARGGLTWASEAFGSDDEFLRANTEVLGHHAVAPGWVIAGRLQAGRFFQGGLDPRGPFIPPDRRFYAGGPNSVRGFGRNALGQVVYVAQRDQYELDDAGQPVLLEREAPRASASGGTEMVVGSVELRTPSPLFSQYLRLGFFVDGGQVWAPIRGAPRAPLRYTPGVGLRFVTPVGPIRVDAAYNPYGIERGLLYRVGEENDLLLWRTYPDPVLDPGVGRGFWNRIQIHFAVGNAF